MATLTIRNIDDQIRDLLRIKAAKNGHSMESELREIITKSVQPTRNLGDVFREINAQFKDIGLTEELLIDPREPGREPPCFE